MGTMAYSTAVDTSLTHDLSPVDRDNGGVMPEMENFKKICLQKKP